MSVKELPEEKKRFKLWKDHIVSIILIALTAILFSILIITTQSAVTIRIGNSEPEMPISEPPNVFMYPLSDPEFFTVGDIRLVYEFISENRHLVAIDDGEDSYIMPMFKSRDEAIEFMISYFDYLRNE